MKIIDRIKELLKSEKTTVDAVVKEDIVKSVSHHEIFKKMGTIFQKNDDVLGNKISQSFYDKIWHVGASLKELGELDASIGQVPIEEAFAETQAVQTQDFIKAEVKGEIEKADIDSKTKAKIAEDEEKRLNLFKTYWDKLVRRRELYPRKYSQGLGWFYVTIAVFLILADIPLALELTAQGFDLNETEETKFQLVNLFNLNYTTANNQAPTIGTHVLDVLLHNWQVLLLAIGIALCSIYIKIFYDDFVGYPADKAILQYRLLHGLDKDVEAQEQVKKLKRRRQWIKFAILLFTILTIVFLGVFRSQSASDAAINNMTTWPGMPPPPANIGEIDIIQLLVFISITLLFPIISGVCFSLGFNAIQNRRELRRVTNDVTKREKEYLTVMNTHIESVQTLERWQAYISWIDADDFIKKYKQFFVTCYNYGYERGKVSIDNSRDSFERIERIRDRLISKKAFNLMANASSTKKST